MESNKLSATDLKSITGRGIQAMVDGELVHIGKDDLFTEVDGPELTDNIRSMSSRLNRMDGRP